MRVKAWLTLTTMTMVALSGCVVANDNGKTVQTIPVPIIVTTDKVVEKSKDDSVYMCKLSAFTSTYQSENTNRGQARLDVQKQCLKNFHEMFCRESDIKCTKYH